MYEFLVMLAIWCNILSHVNVVSKTLQTKSIDVSSAIKVIEEIEKYFTTFKNDRSFYFRVVIVQGRIIRTVENFGFGISF